MSLKQMAMPKEEGRLGLRDPQILHLATMTRRIYKIWVGKNLVWVRWMRVCYIKVKSLNSIAHKACD